MDLHERKNMIAEQFEMKFGGQPDIWTRAPGRVDLMGSHTDYNQGHVLTMTVDRDTWIAARPRSDRRVAIASLNVPGGGNFSLDQIERDPSHPWTDYVRGVIKVLSEAGYPITGFDALVHSTVPFGSGLSSSAALEMATAQVLQVFGGFQIDPVQMALFAQQAENTFVGVNCGILDQYSSALGQAGCALLLDCRHLTSRTAPIAPGIQVVICDTRAERNLAGTEYGERRAACETGAAILFGSNPHLRTLRDATLDQLEAHRRDLPDLVYRRCRFIIEENQRVLDLAEVLSTGNRPRLRALLEASYVGARDLYEIGAPSMESMLQTMMSGPGVIGARQAGAGFGGCMVALVETEQVQGFAVHVERVYKGLTGLKPSVYPVQASPGAGILS